MLPDSSKTNTMSPRDPHLPPLIPVIEARQSHIDVKHKSLLQKCV